MRHILYFFAFSLLALSSCREDSLIGDSVENPQDPTVRIEATLQGFIQDQDGNNLEGVTVTVESQTTETNEQGFFDLTTSVKKDHIVIQLRKDGYFDQTPVISMDGPGTQVIRAQMQAKSNPSLIQSTSGGTVSDPSGSKVTFAADAFVTEDGSPYSGQVNVFTRYLDPTRDDFADIISGDMSAINSDDEENYLVSYGMLDVVLESPSGEKLQINQAATLEMNIPNTLQSSAPATIPLWHFDSDRGIWEEEGSATLQGGQYVGEVNHFSLWNCDVPFPLVELCGSLTARLNDFYQQYDVCITANEQTLCTGFNDRGTFCGKVPAGEVLILEIIDDCGVVVYSEEIGPFDEDDQIFIDPSLFDLDHQVPMTISGSVIDCDGNAVTDGKVYVIIPSAGQVSIEIQDDGSFSSDVIACEATGDFTYKAFDFNNNYLSAEFSQSISSGSIDLGIIEACDEEVTFESFYEIYDPANTIPLEILEVSRVDSGTAILLHWTARPLTFDPDNYVQYNIFITDWDGDPGTMNDLSIATSFVLFGEPEERYYFSNQSGEPSFENSIIDSYDLGSSIRIEAEGTIMDQDGNANDGRLVLSGIIE